VLWVTIKSEKNILEGSVIKHLRNYQQTTESRKERKNWRSSIGKELEHGSKPKFPG
jgi:hypothetical protein